ncbi:sensor histidine kinase [Salipaludibacillus sp. CF4.18]|uniref:sensor histidine kinase n=1 Tax=Salipaludibacillus sp. CF4.18 TaxID=3373081 RepID=UPI003EE5C36D
MKSFLKKMTLRSKILSILLIIIILLSSFSFILIQSINEMNQVSGNISQETIPELVWIAHWEEQLSVKEYMVNDALENEFCCEFVDTYMDYHQQSSESFTKEQGSPPNGIEHFQRDMDLLDFMIENNSQGLLEYSDTEAAKEYVESEYLVMHQNMMIELEAAKERVLSTMDSYTDRFNGIINKSLSLLLAIMIPMIILAIAAAYRISGNLTRPLEKMVVRMQQIAKGEYGLKLDVTDQVELQSLTNSINHMSRELHESFETIMNDKTYHEQILNSLPVGIVTSDGENKNFSLNSTAKELLDKDNGEFINILQEPSNRNTAFWDKMLSMSIFQNVKVPFHMNGREHSFLISQTHLWNRDRHVIGKIFYFLDITETEKMEKKMHQTEKLALVGELSAGAAHEIRNPLAVIDGFLTLMIQSLPKEDKERFHLPLLKKELKRINSIIEEMLMLTKPSAPELQAVYLEDIIQDILPLIKGSSTNNNIDFLVHLDKTKLLVDAKQIKQVLHNLIRNSIEAMDGNGTISIKSSIDKNDYVVLLQDDGPGIAEKVQSTLFDPFKTSKEQGTGLGLTIAQRILDNHNGKLELKSTSNKGTSFLLKFPLNEERINMIKSRKGNDSRIELSQDR